MLMELVVAEFMTHVQVDECGAHHAHRESQQVDGREKLVGGGCGRTNEGSWRPWLGVWSIDGKACTTVQMYSGLQNERFA